MRFSVTKKMGGFLLQTQICGQTISRRRIMHELTLRYICNSKRFLYIRKGASAVHSLNRLSIVKMPKLESSSRICLCGRRYTSDMKNDEMVKAWMNEINEDFEKEKKLKSDAKDEARDSRLEVEKMNEEKKTLSENDKVEKDENQNSDALETGKPDDLVEPDIHGFTTEEMIELVKQARTSQNVGDTDERTANDDDYDDDDQSDSSSSDSDNDNDDGDSSSSSSDSDSDDSSGGTIKDGNKANPRAEKQSQTGISADSSELSLDDSDIERAASNLRTELQKGARKNKTIRRIDRNIREWEERTIGTESLEETNTEDEYTMALSKKKRNVTRSIEERFKNASDFVKSEIEDFVNIDYEKPEEEVRTWEPPVPLTRGKTGVFDIEELMTVLESVRARDIVVIKIPEEVDFANYMVIVTALSYRHIKAIATDLRWIYKRKKNRKDNIIKVEGEDTKDWFAFDLGNIVLHVFTAETRAKYDLETLWTVGPKFDPKCQEEVKEPIFTLSNLPWLEELEQQVAAQEALTNQNTAQETVTNQNSENIHKKRKSLPNQETQV